MLQTLREPEREAGPRSPSPLPPRVLAAGLWTGTGKKGRGHSPRGGPVPEPRPFAARACRCVCQAARPELPVPHEGRLCSSHRDTLWARGRRASCPLSSQAAPRGHPVPRRRARCGAPPRDPGGPSARLEAALQGLQVPKTTGHFPGAAPNQSPQDTPVPKYT